MLGKFARTHVDLFEYLINTMGFTNIHYYCMANELQTRDGWGILADNMDVFKNHHQAVYDELLDRGMSDKIALLATDQAGGGWPSLDWAQVNMDDITGIYGGHYFEEVMEPDNPGFYPSALANLTRMATGAREKGKNFLIGEFGCIVNGETWTCAYNKTDPLYGLMLAEYVLAALNSGTYAMSNWCFMDEYYNPSTLMEWGTMFADAENGFAIRPSYYAYGLCTRFFRPNSSSFAVSSSSSLVRAGAARCNTDGRLTIAVVNRDNSTHNVNIAVTGEPHTVSLEKYIYDAGNIPSADGLQDYSKTVDITGGLLSDELAPMSLAVYTGMDTASSAILEKSDFIPMVKDNDSGFEIMRKTGCFVLRFNTMKAQSFRIHDAQGRMVMEYKNLHDTRGQIEVRINAGVYFYELDSGVNTRRGSLTGF
jgi:hypothetical protein